MDRIIFFIRVISLLDELFYADIKPFSTIIMKKGWKKRFDKMWFAPDSTIMNWSGLFKEQSFIEKLFGTGEWRNNTEEHLKKDVGDLVKSFIEYENTI